MACVRFSSCVETVSNSSSTVGGKRKVQGHRRWGVRLALSLSQALAEGCLHLPPRPPPGLGTRKGESRCAGRGGGGLTFVVVVGGGEGTLVDVVG